MLLIQNNELSETKEKFLDLEKSIDKVDETITQLKKQNNSDGKFYLLETYDWDNSGERYHKIFLDKELARQEFVKEMKSYFNEEISHCWLPEDFNWIKVEEYEWGWLKFTTDAYRYYRDRQWAKWEKVDVEKYPYNAWRAYNPDYYTEITLTPMTITTNLDDNKEENV